MSTSTEVATQDAPALPAVYQRPAVPTAGPGERSVPIVYLMADLSRAVKSKLADAGDVCAMLSAEDDEPYFLIGGDSGEESFRAFVIGVQRYVTRGGAGDDWERLPDDYVRDPNNPEDDDVNVGFKYAISVPGATFPVYSLLLIRSAGRNAYQKVNFALDNARVTDPTGTDPVMIEFGTKVASSKKGGHTYHQWTAKRVDPTDDELDFVRPIAASYNPAPSRPRDEEQSSGASF